MRYQDLELRKSNTRPLKKSVFKYFRRISPVKKFRQQKISKLLNYDIVSAAKQKANDLTNAVVEIRASKLTNAVGKREFQICFWKNQRFPPFLTTTGRKKFWQQTSQHAAQLNIAPSINAKTAFPSILYRQDSKNITFAS